MRLPFPQPIQPHSSLVVAFREFCRASGNDSSNEMQLLESVYLPLAQWIQSSQTQNPHRVFIFGIAGAMGSGKTVLSQRLEFVLNYIRPSSAGRTISLSLDDFYLSHAERSHTEFLSQGYDPGEGISNRGPAGTHDLLLMKSIFDQLEFSTNESIIRLLQFDKATDDRMRHDREIHGKVDAVIWDGWFLGAAAPLKPENASTVLNRSVAHALKKYQSFFDRLDALLYLTHPPYQDIQRNREKQEQTLERLTGKRRMTPEQIDRFVRYLFQDSWCVGVSSPEPEQRRITFQVRVQDDYRLG